MLHTKKQHLKEYQQLLQADTDEAKKLAKEFFIGVTSFFRDKEAYEILYNEVFPRLLAEKSNNDVIKIWVTACSTGQEAYSIAILLDKYLQTQKKTIEVKIFASDIDETAIEIASKAKYPISSIGNIDEDILRNYFIRHTNDYTILPKIRKQIVFARHNILKDPPFIKNDIVSCRNLLIYLNPTLQQGVLSVLNFALKKDGYLFLGPSENPAPIKSEIVEINSKWKIYKKHGTSFVFNRNTIPSKAMDGKKVNPEIFPVKVNTGTQLSEDFKKILSEELGYAAVYINDSYEIKEVAGDFRRYLSLPDKILNLNLLKMVPVELSGILSTAFRKVLKEKQQTSIKSVRVNTNGNQRIFNIVVKPPQDTASQHYLLVLFGEIVDATVRPATGINDINLLHQNTYIQELENELKETRANLQMAIEGLETTNEELQSSNEELQSANEELQSSNEELQSLNEELHTLNTEHQMRIKELQELNDDLNNYFRSAEIAQIFLDSNLRIRKFNPAAVEMVNIIETDIGRPLTNISNNLKATELNNDIQKVLQNNGVLEKEIQLDNGKACLMRILPYIRQDKRNDGVVITFVDVSVVRNLNNVVKSVFDTSVSGIIVFEAVRDETNRKIKDFIVKTINHAVKNIFPGLADDYARLSLKDNFAILSGNSLFNRYIEIVQEGHPFTTEISFIKEEKTVWYTLVANKLDDGLILTLTNITDRKEAEEKLRSQYNEILKAKESLKQLNSELELKVQERTYDLSQSEERFRKVASLTNDVIWDWNLAENRIWWSDSFYILFGYKKEDIRVRSASFWFENIHPSDKQRVKEGINKAIDGKEKWNSSYRFKKNNGEYATILDRGIVLHDDSGVPYRMLGAMQDISETEQIALQLKSKNDELQSLIQEFKFVTDFMPQMVWATEPDGYHNFFNKRWYDFTGLDYEQTKDKGWSLVLHPDDYTRTWKVWENCLQTGKTYDIEYRMRRHDGEYRWFLARALPLRDSEGKIVKWFGTCTDIHDQKMETDILEQKIQARTSELKRTNLELEASNDELMQFASVASHDLQEPLRKIHIFSNMIKERFLQDNVPATDYINRIIKSSSRATKLINDLLSFSRLSSESLFKQTDLNEIVTEVLGDVELAITDKKAKIEIGKLPEIEAVPGQMRQIFQNMITNALKFTKPDVQPHIEIKAEKVDTLSFDAQSSSNGCFYRISIKDNGIGFDPQYAQKIFTIFQRLHPREKYEGTGIGLAIAKKIIEKHNGIIMAQSREGKGAEFIMILPERQPLAKEN
jgi:two-component system, chemotaxis family, CheB/CheR fusion protein